MGGTTVLFVAILNKKSGSHHTNIKSFTQLKMFYFVQLVIVTHCGQ